MKAQHFYKLLCQKLLLRQIEWGVQNGPFAKNRLLPLTTSLSIRNVNWVYEFLIISCFNLPIAQIYIFIPFVSASVLFEDVFFLRESWKGLRKKLMNIDSHETETKSVGWNERKNTLKKMPWEWRNNKIHVNTHGNTWQLLKSYLLLCMGKMIAHLGIIIKYRNCR